VPGARLIALPEALAVGADYGLTTMTGAPAEARRLAEFVVSPLAQAIFARHGFSAGAAP
jgi:ABC-type molybdate transport system substrate-binding protein